MAKVQVIYCFLLCLKILAIIWQRQLFRTLASVKFLASGPEVRQSSSECTPRLLEVYPALERKTAIKCN